LWHGRSTLTQMMWSTLTHTHTHTHPHTHTRAHTHAYTSFKRALYSHKRAPYSSHIRAWYSNKRALFSCTRDPCHTRTNEGRCSPDYKRKMQTEPASKRPLLSEQISDFKFQIQKHKGNYQHKRTDLQKEACCLFGSCFFCFAKNKNFIYEACDTRSQIWNCEHLSQISKNDRNVHKFECDSTQFQNPLFTFYVCIRNGTALTPVAGPNFEPLFRNSNSEPDYKNSHISRLFFVPNRRNLVGEDFQ